MPVNRRNPNGMARSGAATSDSPWFWLLVFALFGQVMLGAVAHKYGRRQANIERQYQARERSGQLTGAPAADSGDLTARELSTADEPLIPLWPLHIVLGALVAVALGMLIRDRRRQPP